MFVSKVRNAELRHEFVAQPRSASDDWRHAAD